MGSPELELSPLLLPPRELLRYCEQTGEKKSREEDVLLDRIVSEASVPIDEQHAKDLVELMHGPWGQTQSILLRCRIGGRTLNDIVYDIMDGFHRVEGLKLYIPNWKENGVTIKACVYYGCSDGELFDQRIAAANSVLSVRFPRLAVWMNGAWGATPWHKRLLVSQAFGLALHGSSGQRFGLSESETKAITEWAAAKADRWLMPISTIYQNLCIVEAAAPDLVRQVRPKPQREEESVLSLGRLGKIVDAFPLDYDTQRQVAEFVVKKNVSTPQLGVVLDRLQSEPVVDEKTLERALVPGNRIVRRTSEVRPVYDRKAAYDTAIALRMRIRFCKDFTPRQKNSLLAMLDEIMAKIRQ